jgi:hypothetical protein
MKSTFATCSWIQAGYRLRAVASTLSTLIADRAESWSPAHAQYRALLDRRVFRKANSSYIKTRLIVALLHATREIVGFAWRLLFGFRSTDSLRQK